MTSYKKIKNEEDARFTEWQVEKLRSGITSFRLANVVNCEMPSYSYVAYEIESFRPQNHANEPTDKNYLLKAERIRRFVAGEPAGVEKLQLMKDFLLDVEILTEEDFCSELDDSNAFLKVHAYLANVSEIAKDEIAGLKKTLLATRRLSTVSEEIKLNIQMDPSGLYFRILEYFTEDVPESYIYSQTIAITKDNRTKKTFVRRGYGFTSTLDHVFHIFLRGGDPEDRITYIENVHYPMKVENRGKFLIRHGGDITETPHGESDIEEAIRCLNIYNFLPVTDKPNNGKGKP